MDVDETAAAAVFRVSRSPARSMKETVRLPVNDDTLSAVSLGHEASKLKEISDSLKRPIDCYKETMGTRIEKKITQ